MNRYVVVLFAVVLIVINEFSGSEADFKQPRNRGRRSGYPAIFPSSSGTGVFIALAFPLDLPRENVYMSHSVESFYGNYDNATYLIPGLIKTWNIARDIGTSSQSKEEKLQSKTKSEKKAVPILGNCKTNCSASAANKKNRRNVQLPATTTFITRKSFYRILKSKFSQNGYQGRPCLLRMICEAAKDPLGTHNGVLGDIMHIILTPTTTKKEGIHKDYYIAENLGNEKNCTKYEESCPKSVFDLCSRVVDGEILGL